MAKTKTHFLCNSCGSVHPKWMGKCPDCGTWDALEEYKTPTDDPRAASRSSPTGDIAHVALKTKKVVDRAGLGLGPVLVFDDATGEQIEIDFRGFAEEVLKRIED